MRSLGPTLQLCQLCFGPGRGALLGVDEQALACDGVAQGRHGFPAFLFAVGNGLFYGGEQFKGFLVVILAVVEGAGLHAAGHGFVVLRALGVCVVSLQEQVACLGVVFFVEALLCLLSQVVPAVLCGCGQKALADCHANQHTDNFFHLV